MTHQTLIIAIFEVFQTITSNASNESLYLTDDSCYIFVSVLYFAYIDVISVGRVDFAFTVTNIFFSDN